MTGAHEAGWPKTPSGAIDWEKAFEDPQAGLIPLILQVRSPAAMRGSMIVVIRRIYTRQDDPSEIERFVAQLTTLIPDHAPLHHLPRVADTMVGILRQIKTDRIQRVLEFESTKAASISAVPIDAADQAQLLEERRSKAEQLKLAALAKAAIARKRKRFMLVVGSIAATIITAGIVASTYIAGAPKRELKHKTALLIEQMQAVGQGENLATHVFGGAIRAQRVGENWAVVAEGLTLNQCISAGWAFTFKGSIMINGNMPAKASVASLSTLCGNTPENATLTWIPRPEGRQKDSRAKKK